MYSVAILILYILYNVHTHMYNYVVLLHLPSPQVIIQIWADDYFVLNCYLVLLGKYQPRVYYD
jgi:hypothetical protein